jgi:hypothetical protein
MNRHERLRAARLAQLELLDNHGLLRLIDKEPVFAPSLAAALRAMRSDRPPICASCDEQVRAAASWAIISCGEQTVIAAICSDCDALPKRDLALAVMHIAAPGARSVELANLHGRWGSA